MDLVIIRCLGNLASQADIGSFFFAIYTRSPYQHLVYKLKLKLCSLPMSPYEDISHLVTDARLDYDVFSFCRTEAGDALIAFLEAVSR